MLLFLLVPLGLCMWGLLFVAISAIGHQVTSHGPIVAMLHHSAEPRGATVIRVNDHLSGSGYTRAWRD